MSKTPQTPGIKINPGASVVTFLEPLNIGHIFEIDFWRLFKKFQYIHLLVKHILKTYIRPFLFKYEGFSAVTWRSYILKKYRKNTHCKGFSVPKISAKMVPKH